MLIEKGRKCIILMLDAFGIDYFSVSDMPSLKKIAADGFFREGSSVFPSLTNANNFSIICGSFPETHGVTANCYLDAATGKPSFLEEKGFLKSPTLFEKAREGGMKSALVTGKSKTLLIAGSFVDFGAAAQDCDAQSARLFGAPPDIYSSEVNEWILRAGITLLDNSDNIDVLYLHTTDYAMHMWPPEDERSLGHLAKIDALIGEIANRYPDAVLLITADHGMNAKTVCIDCAKTLAENSLPVRIAISPVADRLVKHHGGHGGVSYLYLNDPASREPVIEFLSELDGVDEALAAREAAEKYRLDPERIGDIVVAADLTTVFGSLPEARTNLGPSYRNHGSRFEQRIPLIARNVDFGDSSDIHYNFDLTRKVFF